MSNQITSEMVERMSWDEFRNTKMLWFVNRLLHVFGLAIVVVMCDDGQNIKEAYPARVKFRGFGDKHESEGFIGVSEFMAQNATTLLEESKK